MQDIRSALRGVGRRPCAGLCNHRRQIASWHTLHRRYDICRAYTNGRQARHDDPRSPCRVARCPDVHDVLSRTAVSVGHTLQHTRYGIHSHCPTIIEKKVVTLFLCRGSGHAVCIGQQHVRSEMTHVRRRYFQYHTLARALVIPPPIRRTYRRNDRRGRIHTVVPTRIKYLLFSP